MVTHDNFQLAVFIYRIKKTIYSTGIIDWIPLWFLTSLFLTTITFTFFNGIIFCHIASLIAKLIILFGLLTLGYFFLKSDYSFYCRLVEDYGGLPWSVDLLPITLFYFGIGYLLKPILISNEGRGLLTLLNTSLSLFAFILLAMYSHDTMDLNLRKYDGFAIPFLKSMFGIFVIIGIANLLTKSKLNRINGTMAVLGKTSLVIFIFHDIIQKEAFSLCHYMLELPENVSSITSLGVGIFSPVLLYFGLIQKVLLFQMVYAPTQGRQMKKG